MNILLDLFLTFSKVGVMMFGGGLAMLPVLKKCVIDDRMWITDEELTDCFAISQCTPGVIAVNTATYVGCKTKGVAGGIIATLGVVFPSIIIITLIAVFLKNYAELQIVRDAFAGIRACVCVLIVNAVIKLWKKTIVSKFALILFLCAFAVAMFTSLSKVLIIVAAGVAGIAFSMIGRRCGK